MSNANTKIAGAIVPELNERTLTIDGKALRIFDNQGRIRWAAWEQVGILKRDGEAIVKIAKDLKAKILKAVKEGVTLEDCGHTLALGKKTNTSASWKGYAVELLECTEKEAEAAIKDTEHYKSKDVDCLLVDGKQA